MVAGLLAVRPAAAQDAARPICAGEAAWPDQVPSGDVAALTVYFQQQGYYAAHADTLRGVPCVVAGEQYAVSGVQGPTGAFEPLVGGALRAQLVDSLALAVLEEQERQALIHTVVRLDSVQLEGGGVRLAWSLEKGRRAHLLGLLVSGQTRASPRYLRRVTGLEPGQALTEFDAAELRRRLQATGLFARIDTPLLIPTGDTTAVVQLVVSDRAPGSFDLAMGYLPRSGRGGGGIVGSGRLLLRNLFGGGRTLAVELDRLPGSASGFEAHAADPYVLGRRLGAEATFQGYQQDSTFSRQDYALGARVRLDRTDLTAHVGRIVTRPGTAGTTVVGGRQRVATSRARYAGLGLAYNGVDDSESPTAGVHAEARLLRGRTARSALEVAGGDTTRVDRGVTQDRLEGALRAYLSRGRVTVVSGLDLRALVADIVDSGDLYRLGGASTLRGYDEDRFHGRAVGRGLFEVRRRLEAATFAYLFLDVGFVESPASPGFQKESGWYPGYGLGAQLDTGAGLLNISYAANPDDGLRNGRVHFGIAFGL